jgi:hypothetical protein
VAQTVGFIGLGNMGLPIARNLAKAGYRLRVYSRTAAKVQPLLALDGVSLARTPVGVVERGGVVLSMLADDNAVEEATAGVAEGLGVEGLHVSLSTIAPATSTRLAGQGCGYVMGYPRHLVSPRLHAQPWGHPGAEVRRRRNAAGPVRAAAGVCELNVTRVTNRNGC